MEFKTKLQSPAVSRRRESRIKITASSSELEKLYPTNLSFYVDPPEDSISLKEFEEYVVNRLTLLRTIERVNLTSNIKYSKEWKETVVKELEKLNLNQFLAVVTDGNSGITDDDRVKRFQEALCLCRKYDCISHYILRLAFCRSEELCKWFIAMEVDFFRLKFLFVSSRNQREIFLEKNNLQFEKASDPEIQLYKNEISNSQFKIQKNTIPDFDYYKVPFTFVLDLVRTRRIFLTEGIAYVSYSDLIVVIAAQYRKLLSLSLAWTKKAAPRIQRDDRLSQILTNFEQRYTGKNYGGDTKKNGESVTFQDLPAKASNSFPLCMKELYNVVEREHHLKHFGRLQLGLFLKGIGLPIEDATKFWRSNFTKKAGMDANRFDKQYLYNIRHMYGKEGKRADYTPYSCMKIITSAVGAGDHHGCPFRHSDVTPLRSRLVAAQIPENGITEILNLTKDKHYQIACQKYFEYTHSSATVEGGIQHPNQFYEESENVNLGRGRKARINVPTTTVKVYASSQKSMVSSTGSSADDNTAEAFTEEEDPEVENELVRQAERAEAEFSATSQSTGSDSV